MLGEYRGAPPALVVLNAAITPPELSVRELQPAERETRLRALRIDEPEDAYLWMQLMHPAGKVNLGYFMAVAGMWRPELV